jgi:hypothetical protein
MEIDDNFLSWINEKISDLEHSLIIIRKNRGSATLDWQIVEPEHEIKILTMVKKRYENEMSLQA